MLTGTKLTRHEVGQLLGLDRWQSEDFLARRHAQRPLGPRIWTNAPPSGADEPGRRRHGPLRYLVAIDAIQILPALFPRILVPPAVVAELRHPMPRRPFDDGQSRPLLD